MFVVCDGSRSKVLIFRVGTLVSTIVVLRAVLIGTRSCLLRCQ